MFGRATARACLGIHRSTFQINQRVIAYRYQGKTARALEIQRGQYRQTHTRIIQNRTKMAANQEGTVEMQGQGQEEQVKLHLDTVTGQMVSKSSVKFSMDI